MDTTSDPNAVHNNIDQTDEDVKPFRFMNLPRELRDKVYEECLVEPFKKR